MDPRPSQRERAERDHGGGAGLRRAARVGAVADAVADERVHEHVAVDAEEDVGVLHGGGEGGEGRVS
eukprot:29380-Pelagococcus_subviridis.AAC.22